MTVASSSIPSANLTGQTGPEIAKKVFPELIWYTLFEVVFAVSYPCAPTALQPP
jgi:hypothetical protein